MTEIPHAAELANRLQTAMRDGPDDDVTPSAVLMALSAMLGRAIAALSPDQKTQALDWTFDIIENESGVRGER